MMKLETPCIEWRGSRNDDGYGQLKIKGKVFKAHRLAYVQARGISLDEIEGQVVRHRCDNRRCVNPEHLEIGSVSDNTSDMVERGRQSKGENRPAAKLTDELVRRIRLEFVRYSREFGAVALAQKYGVNERQIQRVLSHETWKHVE